MKNILVFPCGTEIGLEIFRSLHGSTHFNLVGGSSINDHGQFVYKNYVGDIPFVDDPAFIENLNTITSEQSIDYIFPAHDSVVLKLAQAKKAGTLSAEIITSPEETCTITRSKSKTYEHLKGVIPTPKIFADSKVVTSADLPLFLKPDVGQGSKGTHRADSIEDLEFYVRKDPTLLVLEYLPGKEFTVDCFTDKNGKLLFSEGRERRRVSNGISVGSVTSNDERLSKLAGMINQSLGFRGVWFFQVKEDVSGNLVLLEIAPRVAGTMGLVRCKGVNLPLLSMFDAEGYDVEVIENKYDLRIDRALSNKYKHDFVYQHVYLDFDDLVILNGKVNTAVVAYVYQCINNGTKVHLLTKHKDDLKKTLEKHRLSNIFDNIIWIKNNEDKFNYINERDAIFIDDSFAERKLVQRMCGIPVFDTHMIESLMED